MSIVIKNLTKQIANRTILHDINISVNAGEIVGFLGPNGAGKTTTLKITAGALDFQQGNVMVCGIDVKENRLQTSGKIGYLPETNALYEDMYVKEYLLFVAQIRKLKEKKPQINELILQVGLQHESSKRISELSKGCRQRVGIAQALLSDPDVLILDEPTSGLDPIQMDEIRNLIREIGRNRTVILSSHNMEEVKQLCTRAIIIHQGHIVADIANVHDLRLTETETHSINVEFDRPFPEELLRKTFANAESITQMNSQSFTIVHKNDIRKQLFNLAVSESNAIITLTQSAKSLDDIFRKYTS